MKKKIFLMLTMVAMLICIFAISVSAEVTIYDDAPARTNIQVRTDDIVEFYDGFKCPTAYVFKDISIIEDRCYFSKCMDFDYINKKLGKTEDDAYTFDDVKGFDIPEGITYIGVYAGRYECPNLKWVSIPNTVTSMAEAIFQQAPALEECVLEFDENHSIKQLPKYMFNDCKTLKTFSMPNCIETVPDYTFSGCSELTAVYLSKNLTTIICGGQAAASFDNCQKMYLVNEPFKRGEIPSKPETYYFPESFSSISNECVFRGCNSLNDVLVFGENLTSVPSNWTFQNDAKSSIVFLGNMENVDSSNWGSKTLYFANEADKSASDIATLKGSQTKYYCYAEGNTNHLVSDKKDLVSEATCVDYAVYATKCYCGKTLGNVNGTELDPDNHDLENATLVSIVYAKYTDKGVKKVACGYSCGENIDLDVDAIFKTLGYSIKNDGCGITNDYEINVDALNEYKEYLADNGKTFTFGVFIGNSEYFTGNAFVNADGTMDNSFSYIQAVNSLDYSKVKCTVADFTLAEKDLPLVMGIYVIDDGKVSYVQHEGTYEKEITKGDVTLDVVTITKIADLSDIDLTLPETKALPVENKEN